MLISSLYLDVPYLIETQLRFDIFHYLRVKLSIKLLCYILLLLCFDGHFFCTFRELGTSIFAINDIEK